MRYLVWDLFGPKTWPLWLLAFAAAHFLWADRRGKRHARGRRLVLAAFTILILFGVVPLGSWLIRPLEARFPPSALVHPPGTIVVLAGGEALGAAEWRGALETSDAGERVFEGAALAHHFPSARLAIAGGVRLAGGHFTDVQLTADGWRRIGVDPDRIVVVDKTPDTCANAVGSKHLPQPILLVTSAAHMPRSVACFRVAGIDPLVFPVDYRAVPPGRFSYRLLSNLDRLDFALHEWIGLAYYRLTGRTTELLPSPR